MQAVCTGFLFLSLSRYEVSLKPLKNLFLCILPYFLRNHNSHNFRFHLQKCVEGSRCAVVAAEASVACGGYASGRGRAEVYFVAGCAGVVRYSVVATNEGEAPSAGSVRFLSTPSSCYLVER